MKKSNILLWAVLIGGLLITGPRVVSRWQGGHVHNVPSVQVSDDEARWLALNTYFHQGRANSDDGRKAITAVVFNRLDDREHYWGPKSIRGIITFRYQKGRKDCDFSWYCDGRDDDPAGDPARYAHDLELAKRWLREYRDGTFDDPTSGAVWFLNKRNSLPSSWPKLVRTGTFGEYSFYRYP